MYEQIRNNKQLDKDIFHFEAYFLFNLPLENSKVEDLLKIISKRQTIKEETGLIEGDSSEKSICNKIGESF